MTGFLASVRSAAEARLVLPAGVDFLDAKEPGAGALGAVDDAVLREIVTVARAVVPVSATIGDLAPDPAVLGPAITRTWAAGVDIVKVGVFGACVPACALAVLAQHAARGVRIVLVYFAEHWSGTPDCAALRRAQIAGVMLDTGIKDGRSLPQCLAPAQLRDFVRAARAAGLMIGLAGSLREADIAPLSALAPDYLGFRGALCGAAGRGAGVEPERAFRIAAALRPAHTTRTRPRDGGRTAAGHGRT